MKRKILGVVALAAVVGIVLSGCAGGQSGASSSSDGALTTVTLRHSWIPDDLMMPITAAKELGYYKDEGIDMQDQVGDGGATAAKLVANGTVMIGVGEGAHVLTARSNGLDIVNFATQNQWSPLALVSLKKNNITTWDDLRGKKISISFTSSAYAMLQAALKEHGLSESDVQFVNLAAGADLTTALPNGDIDVASTFVGNIAPLDYRDDLNVLTLADGGIRWPSTGYFVKESFLKDKNNQELLTRFLRATMKGYRYSLDDPDASAKLLAKAYPDVDATAAADRFKMDQPFMEGDLGDSPLGWQNLDYWNAAYESMQAAELLGPTKVDVKASFTNDIVEAVNAK